jgi:hypothetical protein
MEVTMHEDSACGKGCGLEPMGCTTCDEVRGHTYDPHDDPDLYHAEQDEECEEFEEFEECDGDCTPCRHAKDCPDADTEGTVREDFGQSGAFWD